MLNQEFEWEDLRFLINSKVSYDATPSFVNRPVKTVLPGKTVLYRLGPPVTFGISNGVWWTPDIVFQQIIASANSSGHMRQEWQNILAMPKPTRYRPRDPLKRRQEEALGAWRGEATVRTHIAAIVLTEDVYGWVGRASGLFHKVGGAEQAFLPNLGRGWNGYRSDVARLLETYTLPAI